MSAARVATGFTSAVAIAYSANRHVAVVGERDGRLTLLRETSGAYEQRLIGEGYRAIAHLAYDDVSDRLVVADGDGVWVARLAAADRADATAFARVPGDVRALNTAFVAGTSVALVLDGDPSPRLAAYPLGEPPGRSVDTLLDSLDGAYDAAVADSTSAFVLTCTAAGDVLQLADWRASVATQMSTAALPFGGRVAALDSQRALIVSSHGEFACVRRDGALHLPIAAGSPAPVTAVAITGDGQVLMTTGDSVVRDALPSRADRGWSRPVDSAF